MDIRQAIDDVREFQQAGRHPAPAHIGPLEVRRRGTRVKWLIEEAMELLEGEEFTDQVDALLDLLYFVLGTAVEMGIDDLSEEFRVVHLANMRKVSNVASITTKADGKKTGKPPGWIDPRPELARTLVKRYTGRELISAEVLYDCVPAALRMCLLALGEDVALDQIRSALPPPLTEMSGGSGPSDMGVRLDGQTFIEVVKSLVPDLAAQYVPVDALWEGTFGDLVQHARDTGGEVLLAVDSSALDPTVPPFGHILVVDRVYSRSLRVVDPGPKTEGLRWIDLDAAFFAVMRKGVGVWFIHRAKA